MDKQKQLIEIYKALIQLYSDVEKSLGRVNKILNDNLKDSSNKTIDSMWNI